MTSFMTKKATREYSHDLLDRLPKKLKLSDIESDDQWEKVSGF
jgi:hypothetical protein